MVAEKKPSLPNQFLVSGDFLSNFIEALPHPAHVKNVKRGEYTLSNPMNAQIYGLASADDLVGLTVHDLDQFMNPYWGNAYANTVDKLDHQVQTGKRKAHDERAILTSNGFIRVQDMIKIPVIGANRKVVSIFTFSYDLTHKVNLFKLYALYKQHYRGNEAIPHFLKYLKIHQFFKKIPTDAEISILLAMRSNDSHKWVSNKLDIEPKTVETHSSHIRNKLKNTNLHQLLAHIRNDNRY